MVSELFPSGARGHCVVIGGGLAGISAACALVDQSVSVTLLEKRPFLGGRAFSFVDAETGKALDDNVQSYTVEQVDQQIASCDSRIADAQADKDGWELFKADLQALK